ncbi:hypothetical protein MBLNU230_g8303t1 [Neophaeotheca triangularis]
MSAPSVARALRRAAQRTASSALRRPQLPQTRLAQLQHGAPAALISSSRSFSISQPNTAGMMPDAENPQPPKQEADSTPNQPTPLDPEEYHTVSDEYMDAVCARAEELQEAREDVEVEYSAGVMNITFPPNGTYVLNKQPPNKQIWLSSPLSGPKRFDWVVAGEAMHQKEGGGTGDWIYLRDGSSLTSLLRKELGISVDLQAGAEAEKGSRDPAQ